MMGSSRICRAIDSEETVKVCGLLQAITTVQFLEVLINPTTNVNLVGDKTLHDKDSIAQTVTEQLCKSDDRKYSPATVIEPPEYAIGGLNEKLLAIDGEGHNCRDAFEVKMLVEIRLEK